ncbi:MAG: alkaline phosphatase D family protein [Sedimenticola sp.]
MDHQIQSANYPNATTDVGIQGAPSPWSRMLVLRPNERGRYSLFIHPRGACIRPYLVRWDIGFPDQSGPPARIRFSPAERHRGQHEWEWLLVPWPRHLDPSWRMRTADGLPLIYPVPEEPEGLSDADLLMSQFGVMRGTFDFSRDAGLISSHKITAWSCNQPYDTKDDQGLVAPHVEQTLKWYEQQVDDFKPSEVWGLGDTGYSDGTSACNMVRQVDENPDWINRTDNSRRMRTAYGDMYRAHWSFDSMQRVMRSVPHICMWDDHEIRDGWGSEESDFQAHGIAMQGAARQAAEDYILDLGPRVRPRQAANAPIQSTQSDAHQAYIDNEVATFVFDGRSNRRYRECSGRVISDEQMGDFMLFCQRVAQNERVKTLLLGIGVPLVNLSDALEAIASTLPDWLNDMAHETRDDVRDSWNSPGNRAQLKQLMEVLLGLHRQRPDLEIATISGDIHLANAFTFQPPGFAKPIYQLTTSAITNRQSPPAIVTSLGGQDTEWSWLTDMISYVIPATCRAEFSLEGLVKGTASGLLLGTAGGALGALYGSWELAKSSDKFWLAPLLLAATPLAALLGGVIGGVSGFIFGGFSVGANHNDNPIQSVHRLWEAERNPNIMLLEQSHAGLIATLRTYDLESGHSAEDRVIRLGIDRINPWS